MSPSNPKRSGNPARRAVTGSSVPAQPVRGSLAEHSKSILTRLTRLPRYTVPGIVLALMLVGLSAPLPYAIPALLVVAALVAWLAVLSWPALPTQGRVLRAAVMVILLFAVLGRAVGWL